MTVYIKKKIIQEILQRTMKINTNLLITLSKASILHFKFFTVVFMCRSEEAGS